MRKSLIALLALAFSATASAQYRVSSQQTVGGFVHVESVSYDPAAKALYLSEFGTEKLDPLLKDGMGRIVKTDLVGKVLDKQFLPAAGGEKLNKPKGNWVQGNRFWEGEPKVTSMFTGKDVYPNGLYPGRDGQLLMAGFFPPNNPKGLYLLGVSRQVKALSEPIGMLDGLYRMEDGSLLATDWKTGSLFQWTEKSGVQTLADGFKGPADFCVFPQAGGLTVVVPDLVQGQLRIVQLRK